MKNIMLVEYCHHIGCRVRQHIGSYVPWSAYQGLSSGHCNTPSDPKKVSSR
jgi:hypothetical protein